MQTKLTLRMDEERVRTGKIEASRRGKSVSRIVGEFFDSLASERKAEPAFPPITSSLLGLLKGRGVSEGDYRKHLREKHS
jgi:hypothetical protein